MPDQPLVSIVTPVYNSSRYIRFTLDSVLAQTYTNWEHLLVDDCSTDESIAIIEEYARKDNRFKLFKLGVNSGSGPARNMAIENAKGKFIAFIDSDDIWVPDRLEKHIRFIQEHHAIASHTSYGYIDESGNAIRNPYRVAKISVDYKYLLKRTDISCLTAIYDQDQIGKFYMPDLRRKQDYALWLAILKTGVKSLPLDEVLAYYRQHKDSATSNKWSLILKHYIFLRKHQNQSIFNSLKYTGYWIVGGIFKHLI